MQATAPPLRQPSLDVLKPLRRRAVIAWVGAALSVGLLWGEHQLRVLHPLSLVFILLLVITSAAAVGGLVRGLWRARRGPRRLAALGWTGISILPGLLWPALGWYGWHEWHRREVPHQLPFTLVKMAAAALMEDQARYFYPHRLETERLVMFYRDGLADPEGDIKAMDRHVAHLEEMTGLVHRQKIWWVRGPLLGQSGLALYGLALGSSASPASATDRHELAHAVFYQHAYPDSDPPMLLMEGWAESQAVDPNVLAARALSVRQLFAEVSGRWAGMSETEQTAFLHTLVDPDGWQHVLAQGTAARGSPSYLRELTGPFWYHRDAGLVYSVGGAFVDFLLRRYGAQRFVQLCFACRPGTFGANCQSIYGTDLDTLEKQFWDDLEQRKTPVPPLKSGTR
jgi:hypothetical protein